MSSESTAATPARSPVFVASVIANGVLTVGLVIVAALYFQATTELAATKAELAKEVARAAELKTDLNSARTELQSLAAQSTKLKSEMEAKEQVLAKEKSRAESATAALEREKARLFLFASNFGGPPWVEDWLASSPITHPNSFLLSLRSIIRPLAYESSCRSR